MATFMLEEEKKKSLHLLLGPTLLVPQHYTNYWYFLELKWRKHNSKHTRNHKKNHNILEKSKMVKQLFDNYEVFILKVSTVC